MSTEITTWISRPDGDYSTLKGFRHWWLVEVKGYRLDVHCQACLLGNRNWKFSNNQAVDKPVSLRGRLVYLCGVAEDFQLRNNFHAPAEFAPGESFTLPTYNGFVVHFENARRLAINPLPPGWNGLGEKFTRCRNYQFAVQMEQRRMMAELT